ncbi:cob(I)yrinic acid a,c-diamide adenosyltransferase [Rhodocaloribacter litoris]|uniref:cob(I)yrinic acid a,c-diamide adenosyltransferase n=1 Tax=Rhodocaloribacter litoris TaxID=2558931 RepID=UPI00141EF3F5|nr:cob(I)yrinic acid a,c-diamide adenosyltransferase [Rhodocaloribacter litoris]QXD15625.1 cob(I)yrinic acid a,c-diamide adenosyltransferase [Rhodocaloribacter litoris]GIV61574.1 MAG: ATP--cob(I)alamin adenosyltransferase [Rhodothermaceae bacterium]
MKIYTRTGDAGDTALFGGGRVQKNHPRIEAYGTVDETNSFIGAARAQLTGRPGHERLDPVLARIQAELFELGADLATPGDARPVVPRIQATHIRRLETAIDDFDTELPPLKHFILPGGTPAAAALHVARTVCRRAERRTVELAGAEPTNPHAVVYLNRLSDFLFVAARWVNHQAGLSEAVWKPA